MLHVSQSDLVRRLAESASQSGQSNEQLAAQIAEMEQRNSEIVLMNEMVSLLQACVESVEVHGIVAKHMLKMFKSMSGMLATTRERARRSRSDHCSRSGDRGAQSARTDPGETSSELASQRPDCRSGRT